MLLPSERAKRLATSATSFASIREAPILASDSVSRWLIRDRQDISLPDRRRSRLDWTPFEYWDPGCNLVSQADRHIQGLTVVLEAGGSERRSAEHGFGIV
jgi:hypothetical protein